MLISSGFQGKWPFPQSRTPIPGDEPARSQHPPPRWGGHALRAETAHIRKGTLFRSPPSPESERQARKTNNLDEGEARVANCY